jgi:hypothetical protein
MLISQHSWLLWSTWKSPTSKLQAIVVWRFEDHTWLLQDLVGPFCFFLLS